MSLFTTVAEKNGFIDNPAFKDVLLLTKLSIKLKFYILSNNCFVEFLTISKIFNSQNGNTVLV